MDQDKKVIQEFLESITPTHSIDDTIFLSVIRKVESQKKKKRTFSLSRRIAVPIALALIISVTSLFPVFGSEKGSLIDVYNSYKLNRSLHDFKNQSNSMVHDQSIAPYMLSSLLEQKYGIDPVEFLETRYIYNVQPLDAVFLLLVSKEANIPVEDLIRMRKNRLEWGVIVRHTKITPQQCMQFLRDFQASYRSIPREGFALQGRIRQIDFDNHSFFVEQFPYPIFVVGDLTLFEKIQIGSPIAAKIMYNYSKYRYELLFLEIKPLRPDRPISFVGYLISLSDDTLVLGSKDGRRIVLHIPHHFSHVLMMDTNVSVGCLIKIISFIDREGNYQIIDYLILSSEEEMKQAIDAFPPNQQGIGENKDTSWNLENSIQKGSSLETPCSEESVMLKKAQEIVKKRMNAFHNHMRPMKP
ncbi:MAG TPA: hypothetical protein PLE09_01760 [Caldisericia bacterium]|jgi:hypothetical protein|nr:hypothetical protein [Caldisericia bacterium]HXK51264.1 hypothetical protein [Caldisericia bacterium]